MVYEPTTWQTGDKVTAEKLNKLEQGVAGASAVAVTLIRADDYEATGAFDASPNLSVQDALEIIQAGVDITASLITTMKIMSQDVRTYTRYNLSTITHYGSAESSFYFIALDSEWPISTVVLDDSGWHE